MPPPHPPAMPPEIELFERSTVKQRIVPPCLFPTSVVGVEFPLKIELEILKVWPRIAPPDPSPVTELFENVLPEIVATPELAEPIAPPPITAVLLVNVLFVRVRSLGVPIAPPTPSELLPVNVELLIIAV